ncbi:MAG: glycosyltransferase, partial [Phycisphaerales bacterium JB065]
MPLWLTILIVVLIAASLLTLAFYAVVAYRVVLSTLRLPTARDGMALAITISEWPELTVIIPAHNERDVIARVARSLLASNYPDLGVVFVLDRCTDDTEAVLREAIQRPDGSPDPRVEIILNDHCPDDWAGKVHAMHRGYRESTRLETHRSPDEASWEPRPGVDIHALDRGVVLFADADTEFDPACLRATVALLIERDLDLLSLLSTLTTDKWYEKAIQPVAAFELIRQFPLDLVNDPTKPRSFANGQFMLFRRAAFDSIGGHAGVKNALLEDVEIARIFGRPERDLRLGCLVADGMLHCEMYRTYEAFQRGWKRIYTESAIRNPGKLNSAGWRLLLTGTILPLLSEIGFWVAAITLW